MAATSRDRVTITLGRNGQVVNRAISTANGSFNDSEPLVGAKRSVRDRLGSRGGDGHSNGTLLNGNNKRLRGDIGSSSSRAKGLNGTHIDKGDLRLKLMKKKNESKQEHRSDDRKFGEDLRDKLKKTRQMSALDSQRRMPERKESGGFGQASSTRRSDDLPKMDCRRDSYSNWASDRYSQRSPDMIPHSSRGLSPRRSVEDIQRRPLSRAFDDVRLVPYMSNDLIDTTRPMTSVAFQSGSVLPPGPLKPIAPPLLSQLPPPNAIMPKSSFMVDELQTVDGLLHSLGLGKYVVIFKAEEVDMTALKQMGENDLKELGIPMGPRKKILLALLPHSKRSGL